MDHTDLHPTQGDPNPSTPTANVAAGCEHEASGIVPTENLCVSDPRVGPSIDTRNTEADKRQGLSGREYPDTWPAENVTDHEDDIRNPQNEFNQVAALPMSERVYLPELLVVPAGEFTSTIDFNASEISTTIHDQGPPSLHSRTASETSLHDDTPKDLGRSCDDFASSQLPSSSPPQLFSSSPCASSQSSDNDIEHSKMVRVDVQAKESAGTRNRVLTAQDESESEEPRRFHGQDVVHVVIPTADHILPSLCVKDSPGPSEKRMATQSDDDQSDGQQPTKRLKSGSHLHLPPAPMRATLASQNRQFKKLAAPFRPPSKLPVARDEPVQTTNVKESAKLNHDEAFKREHSAHVLRPQHKVSNTSRSVTQFKSPLINRVSSADTRTIRLTPALQALERQLQLLKRAVKVKEDNEEAVLTRLAGKWIEAGREVAYEVWDATKDAANVEEKAVLARGSYGWENTDKSWGWDNKREDAGEGSHDPASSMADCLADPLDAEGDAEDGFHNTLGTMLRQLGIAPEIFGWDDDKEVFCD